MSGRSRTTQCWLIMMAAALLVPARVATADPGLTYQGALPATVDGPDTGAYAMRFLLYDADGMLVWCEPAPEQPPIGMTWSTSTQLELGMLAFLSEWPGLSTVSFDDSEIRRRTLPPDEWVEGE